MEVKEVKVSENVSFANNLPLVLIAGPCQIESREHTMKMAEAILEICNRVDIKCIFKSSFDKANRTSVKGKRGVGLDAGLKIFEEVKSTFKCPVLTDVHTEAQCKILGEVVDVLQVPAFLSRQTDMLKAAAETGRVINIKKGQFLAPTDAKNIVDKMEHFGNANVLLTERGVSFGYNNLVVDMRSFPIMARTGYPVIFDATHSTQSPGGLGGASGGDRTMVPYLSRAAVACGVAGIFMEVHDDPDNAPSDGPCMVKLETLEGLLVSLKQIDNLVKVNYF